MKRKKKQLHAVVTKLTGEELLLLEDLAIREGKSRYQLIHDILTDRLDREFGDIDFGFPHDWEPVQRHQCKKPEIELQLNFTF